MMDVDVILRTAREHADVVRRAALSLAPSESLLRMIEDARRHVEAFDAQHRAAITELIRTVNLAAERRAEEEPHLRELSGILAVEGWVGLENYLHADSVDILREVKEKGTAWLEQEICVDFRDEKTGPMKELLEGWWRVPYLSERRDTIEDAVRAHRERRYALSISALMPLIDGLTADIVGAPPDKRRPMVIRDAAEAHHKDEQEAWSDCLLRVVNERVCKGYDFGTEAPPSMINRHGILHGRISGFGTEANSVRTILLVDVFARIAQEQLARATAA